MPSHTPAEKAKGRKKLIGSSHGGRSKLITKAKAGKILKHGEVKGKPLTKKQKGFFGARAGGAPVKGLKKAS